MPHGLGLQCHPDLVDVAHVLLGQRPDRNATAADRLEEPLGDEIRDRGAHWHATDAELFGHLDLVQPGAFGDLHLHDREAESIADIAHERCRVPRGKLGQRGVPAIATFDADLNLKDYRDEYTEGLRRIIDAKIAGEEVVAPEPQEPPKVVNLMEALRRSLDSVSATKKKPAKAVLKKAAKPRAASGAKKRRAS